MNFSNQEKRDMIECYILSNKNAVRAKEQYFEQYFDRHQPSLPTFKRLYDNLGACGSFTRPRNRMNTISEVAQINVLACVAQNSSTSTRKIADEASTSQRTAVKVLKMHKYRPYKLSISQTLHTGDPAKRVEFCTWFRNMCEDYPQFSSRILWTDETRFTNCGMFNRHNEHLWMQENPHHVEQRRPQIKFGFNVWCGVIGSRILGPYIFEGTLTGDHYLHFLQNDFQDMLDNVDLATRTSLQWFQHDGAPPHNQLQVRNFLDQTFPNSWIGRNAPVRWPPRSPDLSILDFFLWGTVKNRVYRGSYDTVNDLREAVLGSFASVDRRSIKKATNSVLGRCICCLNNNGELFEHFL